MSKAEEQDRLAETVNKILESHQKVATAARGSNEKLDAQNERQQHMEALWQLSNDASDDGVSEAADEAHAKFTDLFTKEALESILAASNALDGLADKFAAAADRAEKMTVITDTIGDVANQVADAAEQVAQGLEQVKAKFEQVRQQFDS
jgi:hypothetical protein